MLAALRRHAFWWRPFLLGGVLLLAVAAVFTTFDSITIDRPFARRVQCGSPFEPTPPSALESTDAIACAERLNETRATRLANLTVGLALAMVLLLMYEERTRHPERYGSPLLGLGPVDVTTERLRIRPAEPGDVQAILATIDGEVQAVNGWRSIDVGALASRVAGLLPGLPITLVTVERSSNTVVGVMLVWRRARRHRPSFGSWLGPEHRRGGLGTESIAALVAALHDQGFRAVTFSTSPDNEAIVRIAKRIGATELHRKPVKLADGRSPDSITFVHRSPPR